MALFMAFDSASLRVIDLCLGQAVPSGLHFIVLCGFTSSMLFIFPLFLWTFKWLMYHGFLKCCMFLQTYSEFKQGWCRRVRQV